MSKVIALKVPGGADPVEFLRMKIKELGLKQGSITGVGGFKWVDVGVLRREGGYDVKRMEASDKHFVEVAPVVGNYVTLPNGEVSVHLHVTVGREHGLTWCGHLVKAETWPFLELFLYEADNDVLAEFPHRRGR